MIKILGARHHQGYRTFPFPEKEPSLPENFIGRPEINGDCPESCNACIEACPYGALIKNNHRLTVDIGKCIFCSDCAGICTHNVLRFTSDYRMATRDRQDLVIDSDTMKLADALEKKSLSLFGHSLKLRQVSAGGCNACEADTNVLNTLTFDLGRFGIQFVASPRHADGLLITGPVTENMKLALEKTYNAVPSPKIVIAVGACAISGGPYSGLAENHNGAGDIVKIDLYIPGCPPNPWTILDGLLRLLGRIK